MVDTDKQDQLEDACMDLLFYFRSWGSSMDYVSGLLWQLRLKDSDVSADVDDIRRTLTRIVEQFPKAEKEMRDFIEAL